MVLKLSLLLFSILIQYAFHFAAEQLIQLGISFLGCLDIKDFKCLQPKSGAIKGCIQGNAVPTRREGRKPTSNKQNLDTKKLLLHGTKPESCNDLVNTCFSLLLTSSDFEIRGDYPNTAFLCTGREEVLLVPLQ